ncbi:MAG: hypothetical protein AB6733_12390 [Clostridiaceae bacterium]
MGEPVFINLENEVFKGDVLDIGTENYGIVYSVCKSNQNELAIDYLDNQGVKRINEGQYDTCVVFFSFKDIILNMNKSKLIKKIFSSLRFSGTLHIWDIDKATKKPVDTAIKVALPDGIIKTIKIKDYNFIKSSSFKNIVKLLTPYFDIIESSKSNDVFYIKAAKKGN